VPDDAGAEKESYAEFSAARYKRHFDFADEKSIQVVLSIITAQVAWSAAITKFLATLGLGKPVNRYSALSLLYFSEESSPGELRKELNVTSASMTYMLDDLERDGLVARSATSSDRRMVRIQLTPAGVALCEELIPAVVRFLNEGGRALDEGDKSTLSRLLAKFQKHVEGSMMEVPAFHSFD
jgi:DNA-binding MarR family transcriptional regulator